MPLWLSHNSTPGARPVNQHSTPAPATPAPPGTPASSSGQPQQAVRLSSPSDHTARRSELRLALLGNPNTGKTTLFNRLTGLRAKTSNFPGTTLEAHTGLIELPASTADATSKPQPAALIDLPGIYSLELKQLESDVCRSVLAGQSAPEGQPIEAPHAAIIVLDALNLSRNLILAGELLRRRLPTVVALNMIDLARKQQVKIDLEVLSRAVGCPVVPISARTGEGIPELLQQVRQVLDSGRVPSTTPPGDEAGLRQWADSTFAIAASGGSHQPGSSRTDAMDRVLTHPFMGPLVFAVVMAGLFSVIFALAEHPMGWIETLFAWMGSGVDQLWVLFGAEPTGILHDFLKDGIVAGVGSTVVFLPQIVLLFFLISLLEDTGYLARAALVIDRVLRPFGLPGHAFVPLLSSHACAIPGLVATRTIPDMRERLATILVAPFMSCSARIPVYVLLIGLLFPGKPLQGAIAFVGCYVLGILAGIFSALLARQTLLRGKARPMLLELPSYKMPSLRTAGLTAFNRAWMFLKKAGTAILAISIVLWWLGAFPKAGDAPQAATIRQQAQALVATDAAQAALLEEQASAVQGRYEKSQSFLGMLGRTAQPIFAPLGYDWQLSIGVLASFAAREVFVSTMSIVVAGAEEGDDEAQNQRIRENLATATRDDGTTRVFNPATNWSLLVFYVLAMQCLPTLVVTARESGKKRYALLQFGWMSFLAYVGALAAFWIASAALG
jgi:ferrous iron transport protein B